ncbi:MAG: carbohydrate ABC transporter permease [Gammaproteobacteria bacterium]
MKHSANLRGWILCVPALAAMFAVNAYPMAIALWLSFNRYDLRFPESREFVGFDNYVSILASDIWWKALANTLMITVGSVFFELLLGFALAVLMHLALFGRQVLRSAVLIPYAIITVVAAMAWKFAFDPTVGFINGLLGLEHAWLSDRGSAFFVIIFSEIWKTTPFMALLLMAGLALIPDEVLRAARVDGANACQRLLKITLPLMKPTILVAVLFRTLDAFRIFDAVFILTRGAHGTETVSLVGYNTLIGRLNLGLGSAVAVMIFICVAMLAALFVTGFSAELTRRGGDK